jgi:hypothetical protein
MMGGPEQRGQIGDLLNPAAMKADLGPAGASEKDFVSLAPYLIGMG